MKRADRLGTESDEGLPGEDSFLDIVANIVGILIILVMVVGVRASHGAFVSSASTDENLAAEEATNKAGEPTADDDNLTLTLAAEMKAAFGAQRQLARRVQQAAALAAEREIAEAERERLLAIQSIQQEDIDRRRAVLSESQRAQFDMQRELTAARLKHEALTTEQISLASAAADEVEEIECLPTPMAKEIDGAAIHVRLRRGLLAVVPFDELKDEFLNNRLGYLREGIRSRNEAVDVVGPIDGFRMRLSIEYRRQQPLGASPLVAAHSTRVEQVQTWTLLPTAAQLGLAPEQAYLPGAPLMRRLRSYRAADVAVVAWVYPDSFEELRELKRTLWEMGVRMAVWPLGENDDIVFSSRGSKAAAQ